MESIQVDIPNLGPITIHVPKTESSFLNSGLRRLSQRLIGLGYGDPVNWGLGGSDGYGGDFENEVFLMHRYCWCDHPECPWCADCTCPQSAFRYFVDDVEVTFDEWVDFFQREVEPYVPIFGYWDDESRAGFSEVANAVNLRRKMVHEPVCDFCTKGVGVDKGALPGKPAPNFWFKGSDTIPELRVWWYKWIGRDMQTDRDVSEEELRNIFDLCLASISRYPARVSSSL